MKCAVHQDVDAIGYCRNCGKALCSVCARPIRDVLYCEDCLAGAVGIPAPPPAANPAATPYTAPSSPYGYVPPPVAGSIPPVPPRASTAGSPGVAFVLGLFPGLGAVYNGEYNKALIHIVVFAAMIVGLSSGNLRHQANSASMRGALRSMRSNTRRRTDGEGASL